MCRPEYVLFSKTYQLPTTSLMAQHYFIYMYIYIYSLVGFLTVLKSMDFAMKYLETA